jgi:hypothetical protein
MCDWCASWTLRLRKTSSWVKLALGVGATSREQVNYASTDILICSYPQLLCLRQCLLLVTASSKMPLIRQRGLPVLCSASGSGWGRKILVSGVAGALQQRLVGLYKEDREVEPHRNPKLATWKEDLAAHTEKLEEAKKVESLPMLHCHTGRHTRTISL